MQEIIVGRPRDGSDRVTWLLDHSRFEQALDIIESDVTLSQATREQASSVAACQSKIHSKLMLFPHFHLLCLRPINTPMLQLRAVACKTRSLSLNNQITMGASRTGTLASRSSLTVYSVSTADLLGKLPSCDRLV